MVRGDDEAWRASLDDLLGDPPTVPEEPATPLALQVQARELLPRTAHRWNGPTTRAATGDSVGVLRLGVRPVTRSEKGWARGALTWQSLPHVRNRLGLDPEQHRWACELGALHRAAVPATAGQDPDWLFLDEAPNPLLWGLLEQGRALGVPLVAPGGGTARLAGGAVLALDAVRVAEGFRVAPVLTVEGDPVPAERAHAIGDHGVWTTGDTPAHVVLAPFPTPVDAALLRREPLEVPAKAAQELTQRWLPALQDRFAVTSSDASVPIPAPLPPVLVLAIASRPEGGATLTWRWERLRGTAPPPLAGVLPTGVLPEGVPASGLPPPRLLNEEALLDALADVVPQLAALPGVLVEHLGAPTPRVLTGEPAIEIRVAPTERSDWFDLGVIVTIDGRDIPFGRLFRAIASGKRRLKLVDGTFLSLGHPRLVELVELVEEAAEFPEWASGWVVPKVAAAVFAEFEDLADSTDQVAEWRTLRDAIAAPPGAVPVPAGLVATLRPYQQQGLEWLAFLWRHGLGGVLADDMGLGKTLQCLALLQHVAESTPPEERRPALVVAPTSVASNWVAEAARFTPGLVVRRVTDADAEAPIAALVAGADLVVTTYPRLRLDARAFTAIAADGGFSALILDEAQAVKNAAAVTHRTARDLAVPRTFAVTGTPLENSLTELHALLHLAVPGLFPSARRFREEYVRPIEGLRAGYTEGVGAGNAPEANAAHRAERLQRLRNRMRPFVLRRTKEQVAPELPSLEEQTVTVELAADHRALYDVVLQRERRKLFGLLPEMDRNRFIVLRSLTLLRLLALDAALIDEEHVGIRSAKLDLLADELTEAVAEGRRALVFSQFPSYLKRVGARLQQEGVPWTLLEGATRDRDGAIARFRSGEAAVFLISLKAGGFGLNLVEADLVYLLDPWWNPQAEAQAIDRAHRIGQDKPVTVRRLVAAGTIEEKVLALQTRKQHLFDAVVDDGDPFSTILTAADVADLLS